MTRKSKSDSKHIILNKKLGNCFIQLKDIALEKYYKKKLEKHGGDIKNIRPENPVEQVTFF